MSLIKNYAIWNNKGGVGKSTITYHIATRYAETHPQEDVLVIDMCPQSNISMMLLDGGNGDANVMRYADPTNSLSIVGYMSLIIANGQGATRPSPSQYSIKVNSDNPNMPENLFLLCGDGMLELLASALIYYANQPRVSAQQTEPWKWIHLIIRNFIEDFVAERQDRNVAVFIDTNPAFTIYTEIAIAAADRLICPVNADDSSRIATNTMMILLHGSTTPHPLLNTNSFAYLTQRYGMAVPQVHLVIGNRMTQYDGAATAYRAMSDATANLLYTSLTSFPNYFTQRSAIVSTIEEFNNEYSALLRDFNTAGVVTSHLGKCLSQMKNGSYTVHGKQVQLRQERIDECLDAIDNIVNIL